MSRPTAPHGRTGRPPLTSREQILDGARRIIDRDGWEKLTIRRLAEELGVAPTTLYHHIRDKGDLLIQLLDQHTERTVPRDLPSAPRERIIAASTAMHDSLAAWPWAAEVLTADGFLGRLGPTAAHLVDGVVGGAIDYGCTPDQGVHIFRSLWYYTVGEILVRAHSAGRRQPSGAGFFSRLDATRTPHLAGIGDRWPELAAQNTFPEALGAFVDGLLSQATAPAR